MYCSEVNFCVGTDEAAVIGLLTKRTNAQRQQIMVKFKLMYGKVRERDSGGFRPRSVLQLDSSFKLLLMSGWFELGTVLLVYTVVILQPLAL